MVEVQEHMLTTIDNPYSPVTQWQEWYAWDQQQGYFTTELLARISWSSPELSDLDQLLANEAAIDEIVRYNVNGLYRKVKV